MENHKKNEGITITRSIALTCLEIHVEFPLMWMVCLYEIAINEGATLKEISEASGIGMSNVSNCVTVLSSRKKAYKLLKTVKAPHDRRWKNIYLTDKGRDFLASLNKAVEAARA